MWRLQHHSYMVVTDGQEGGVSCCDTEQTARPPAPAGLAPSAVTAWLGRQQASNCRCGPWQTVQRRRLCSRSQMAQKTHFLCDKSVMPGCVVCADFPDVVFESSNQKIQENSHCAMQTMPSNVTCDLETMHPSVTCGLKTMHPGVTCCQTWVM